MGIYVVACGCTHIYSNSNIFVRSRTLFFLGRIKDARVRERRYMHVCIFDTRVFSCSYTRTADLACTGPDASDAFSFAVKHAIGRYKNTTASGLASSLDCINVLHRVKEHTVASSCCPKGNSYLFTLSLPVHTKSWPQLSIPNADAGSTTRLAPDLPMNLWLNPVCVCMCVFIIYRIQPCEAAESHAYKHCMSWAPGVCCVCLHQDQCKLHMLYTCRIMMRRVPNSITKVEHDAHESWYHSVLKKSR